MIKKIIFVSAIVAIIGAITGIVRNQKSKHYIDTMFGDDDLDDTYDESYSFI